MMKRFLLSLILIILSAGVSQSGEKVIHTGVIGYLGTTEAKFQSGLDVFRDLIPPDYQEDIMYSGFVRSLKTEKRTVHFFNSLMRMIMSLRSGRIDEIMLPDAVGNYVLSVNPSFEIKYMSKIFSSGLSFAFRQEDTALRDDFNSALSAMKEDGTIDGLSMKFVHSDSKNLPKPERPDDFPGAKTITVAVTGDLPPVDMFAGDGKPTGYSTAILSEIGRRLKKNIRFVNVESGARNNALFSGRADVVFWYRTTEIAMKDIDTEPVFIDTPDGVILSVPYFTWQREIVLKMAEQSGFWGLFKR